MVRSELVSTREKVTGLDDIVELEVDGCSGLNGGFPKRCPPRSCDYDLSWKKNLGRRDRIQALET